MHIDLTVEKTEGASNPEKNWQHWVHKTHDEDKQNKKTQHNIICVGNHYTQTSTNNVSKTRALLQTTGNKDEPNITFNRNS